MKEKLKKEIIVLMEISKKHNPVDLNKKIEDLKERINKYIDTVEIDEDLVTYAKYLKILDSIKK
ncbi:hypothetical protein [Myroides pelagicus]|uniref:Uncharacterized protein n=1 Tax=Myroides pelagicus TaxID=270914 RepID=A0A7K1GMT7_9FLAO|nr:hypothetical protein [Myroides pelagicus]MEC4112714.1 hypothetical protein [Myroides pelagicus]MTH29693.1 hypothetical protein [Myroides pelagicus]